MDEQELNDILAKHKLYLEGKGEGRIANLSGAYLGHANLRDANFGYTNLRGADLNGANLSYADLSYADLIGANFGYTNLRGANLGYANLITFQFQKHPAFYTFDGSLRIGCIVLPITEWAETFSQVGKDQNYSEEQIVMYGEFISMCLKHFKMNNK